MDEIGFLGQEIEIDATVTTILYKSDSYAAFLAEKGNKTYKMSGNVIVEQARKYSFIGEWIEHPKYGIQVKVISCTEILPTDIYGIKQFLGSGIFTQLGERRAEMIVNKFGEDTFNVLDNYPDRLTEISGITGERKDVIISEWAQYRLEADAYKEMYRIGLVPKQIGRLKLIYSNSACTILRKIYENPYRLLWEADGFKFEAIDRLAINLGIPRDYRRVCGAIITVLRESTDFGHTYVETDSLINKLNSLDISLQELFELTPEVYNTIFVRIQGGYAWKSIYDAEVVVSCKVKELVRIKHEEIPSIPLEFHLTDEQEGAVEVAQQHSISVITGLPGTGKTYTLEALLNIYQRKNQNVFLAAPTGKAAKRMAQTTNSDAQTIHRLLQWTADGFVHNEVMPLPSGVIIVDEASMLDIELAGDFFRAIRPDEHSVILIGDVNQLPAVGPGSVLNDIIKSGIVPVISLTKIIRQKEESLVVRNAHNIVSGNNIITGDSSTDFEWVRTEGSAEETVEEVISQVKKLIITDGFSPDDIQVLTPVKKGVVGTWNLNLALKNIINPTGANTPQISVGDIIFREGDRIIQNKNNYNIGLMNGEVGIIRKIDDISDIASIDFGDVSYEVEAKDMLDMTLAFALTIHKFQGSEVKAVVIILHESAGFMLRRQLLYTAITRARDCCILVGSSAAVGRSIRNNQEQQRNTLLTQFLKQQYKKTEPTRILTLVEE